ncbi:LiaI-LiaF-like domain-containing protein [Bacillota bacterium Lsc_1132]
MKNQRIFPGIILMGFGAYFFLQQAGIVLFPQFFTWPTLMIIAGIAFLGQGYIAKDYEAILPGVILTGFGLHFHTASQLAIFNNQNGFFIFIIALGFLLRYQKTHSGLSQTILFLVLAIILLFYDKMAGYLGVIQTKAETGWRFWPVFLIIAGFFLLYKKKK